MNLSQLRAVVAVAYHGNFSEAALELNLSQPAISYAIPNGQAPLGHRHPRRGTGCAFIRDEYVALLPPTTGVRSPQITWHDLATHSLVLLPCLPCGRILHKHLMTSAPPMNTAAEIQEDSTIVSMVVQGLGAAILPRLAAAPIPKEVHVYSLPAPLERVIGVAVLSDALHVPAVFAFLDMLRTVSYKSCSQSGQHRQ